MRVSPSVARWELLLRIEAERKRLKLEAAIVAANLGISRSHFYQMMRDERTLTDALYDKLLKTLGLTGKDADLLNGLRAASKVSGWWDEYSTLLKEDAVRLFSLEHGAQNLRTFESLAVPGLLQTEAYARAIVESDIARISPVDADAFISARMRRQELLTGDDPLEFTALLSQAVLLQQTGSADIQRQQLEHLATTIREHKNVSVRIVPFTAHYRPIIAGATFHILGFASHALPTIAWHESVATRGIVDDPSKVRELSTIYQRQWLEALDAEASLAQIESAARELS